MPVIIDLAIANGKPVIKGTRVPVATVLEQLAAGLPPEELVRHLGLTVHDVRDALMYAYELMDEVRGYPPPE